MQRFNYEDECGITKNGIKSLLNSTLNPKRIKNLCLSELFYYLGQNSIGNRGIKFLIKLDLINL